MVWAINRTDDLMLVGDRYLFPGEGRLVPENVFDAARDRYGAGLCAVGDGAGAVFTADDGADGDDESEFLSLDVGTYELSLDVLDGDADAADLSRMTRAELAETARLHGIVPGRMSKRELIEAIRACE